MATLTIRDVSDETMSILDRFARQRGTDVSSEAARFIEEAARTHRCVAERDYVVRVKAHREALAAAGVYITDEEAVEFKREDLS